MSQTHIQTLVIGGGVSGLCALHLLARKFGPGKVLLLEGEESVGGQSRTDSIDGFTCDWGPNGFLDKEPKTLQWIDELGLSQHLQRADEAAAHRFIMKNDRLVEIFPPPKFLLTPLLSPLGRMRLCCEPFIKAKRDDAPESIWHFAARRIGREAADMMVMPMVSGIFGGDATKLSLAHCFPVMAKMEREYGGLMKALIAKKRKREKVSSTGPRGTLTSFKKGIGFLAVEASKQYKDNIRCGAKVDKLTHDGETYQIDVADGETISAKQVVVATPAYGAAEIVQHLDAELSKALASIEFADMAVVCVGYRKDQIKGNADGFGFLVPPNQGKRILGCLWSSSIFPGRAPEGHVQFRAMYGGYRDPEAVKLSDEELLAYVRDEVHPLLKIEGDPAFARIYRHKPAIAQYLLHHAESLAGIEAGEARHPGLVFTGNSYRGVSLNDCVVAAHRAVDILTESS